MLESARIARDLVAIPSVNPMGRPLTGPTLYEGRVSDYLEAYFKELGVPYERTTVLPGRDNVIARFDPPGSATRSLILEAHQDTVPVDDMIIDPFGARIENGRLYGRGACDDKGPMASMLVAFARLVRERPNISTRVYMVCSCDEELGFNGIRKTCESPMVRERDLPMSAICAEATVLDIVIRHKGACRWFLETTGKACHSSNPSLGTSQPWSTGWRSCCRSSNGSAIGQLQAKTPDPLLGTPNSLSVGVIEGGVEREHRAGEVPGVDPIAVRFRARNLEEVCTPISSRILEAARTGRTSPGTARRRDSTRRRWTASPAPTSWRGRLRHRPSTRSSTSIAASGQAYGNRRSKPLALVGVPSVVFGPGDIARALAACGRMDRAFDQLEPAAESPVPDSRVGNDRSLARTCKRASFPDGSVHASQNRRVRSVQN